MLDCAVLTVPRVLRMLNCATGGVGAAATAVALSWVVRLIGPGENSATTPAATLMGTVLLTITRTATTCVGLTVKLRRPLAPVTRVPQLAARVLLPAVGVKPLRVAFWLA